MSLRFTHIVAPFAVIAMFAVGCGGSSPPANHPSDQNAAGLDGWEKNHPEASKELGEWVREHAKAAHLFFDWDGHHPERSKEFVTWALEHPAENIDAFVANHRGWEYFDEIMEKHRPAAETFLAWARKHPKAAEALMNHPRGLEWAGHHLYKSYWEMEK